MNKKKLNKMERHEEAEIKQEKRGIKKDKAALKMLAAEKRRQRKKC